MDNSCSMQICYGLYQSAHHSFTPMKESWKIVHSKSHNQGNGDVRDQDKMNTVRTVDSEVIKKLEYVRRGASPVRFLKYFGLVRRSTGISSVDFDRHERL